MEPGALRALLPGLDEPTLEYLATVLRDDSLRSEADVFAAAGELLLSFGETADEAAARQLCGRIAKSMRLAAAESQEAKDDAASGLQSRKAVAAAGAVTRLSAPVCPELLVPVPEAEEAAERAARPRAAAPYVPSREEIEADMAALMSERERQFVLSAKGVAECEMCGRIMPLTAHHLRPRSEHDVYLKRGLSQEELNTCADLCRPCHSAVHRRFDNKTLAASYFTVTLLLADEKLQRWAAYAAKQHSRTRDEALNGKLRYAR